MNKKVLVDKQKLKEFLEWLEEMSQDCYKNEVSGAIKRFLEGLE